MEPSWSRLAPVAEQLPARLRAQPSQLVLAVVAAAWVAVFGWLTWLRFERFASFGFDMGIYDQAIWLLAHLEGQFVTVRGIDLFGHHANVALYLLTPFYRLGAGPNFLNVLQVVLTASGTIPLYLLARRRLASGALATALGVAYLLHPSLGFFMWEQFHPEVMALTPLLWAYWLAEDRRWKPMAVLLVLAVLLKEDIALTVVVFGVIVAVRGHRRVGLVVSGLALGWFFFVTKVFIPHFAGETFYVTQLFGELGGSTSEITVNALRDPSLVIEPILSDEGLDYLFRLAAPYGFASLLAPGALLLGAPQALVNMLTTVDFTRNAIYHYSALPLLGLTLATVEGIAAATRRRPRVRVAAVGVVVGAALITTVTWGLSPIGAEYRQGWWPLARDGRQGSLEAAVAMVPDEAGVSATYNLVAHLSQRREIYEFPNPFRPVNWGVEGEDFPGPTAADWLVLDRLAMDAEDRDMIEQLLADGVYERAFDRDQVLVARRR